MMKNLMTVAPCEERIAQLERKVADDRKLIEHLQRETQSLGVELYRVVSVGPRQAELLIRDLYPHVMSFFPPDDYLDLKERMRAVIGEWQEDGGRVAK